MNDGVRILIERIETNPEDFEYDGRFSDIADTINEFCQGSNRTWFWFLSEEDKEALKRAWANKAGREFSEHVMKTLFEEPKEEEDLRKIKAKISISQAAQQAQIAHAKALQARALANSYHPAQNSVLGSGANGISGLGAQGASNYNSFPPF